MTYNIGFDIFANDRASKEFKSLGDNMDHAANRGQKLGKVAGTVVVAGLAAAVGFIKSSSAAYQDAAEKQRVLTDAYGRHVKMQDVSKQSYLDQAAALQKKTAYDGDEINAMQGKLGAYGLTGKEIQKLTPLVLDYAAKTGKDLPTAALTMGKAVMGQGRPLKALGINFKDTHTKAGNLAQIMKGVRTQAGGFAEKEGKSAAGQAEIMKNTFGDLQEDIGKKVAPALTNLFKVGIKVVSWMGSNQKVCTILAGALLGGAAAVWVVNKAAKAFTATMKAVNLVMKMNTLGLVITGLVLLGAGLVLAYKKSTTFRNIVNGVWHAVQTGAHFMWYNVIKPVFGYFSSNLSSLWRTLSGWKRNVVGVWNAIGAGLKSAYNNALKPAMKWIVDKWLQTAGWIVHGAATMLGWVPGVGGKLRKAAAAFDVFRRNVNRSLDGVNPRKVNVTANFDWAAPGHSGSGAGSNKRHAIQNRALGGPVTGGKVGKDSVPSLLMPNEFIVRADGSNLHEAMAHFGVAGYKAGGPVVSPHTTSAGTIGRRAQAGWMATLKSGLPKWLHSAAGMMGMGGGPAFSGGSGVARWLPLVMQVLSMLHQSPGNSGAILRRIQMESGGNPRAINLWDSNAAAGHPSMGLMQTIAGTFNAWAGPFRGLGIWNPLANIYAGTNYALHTYGSLSRIDPRNRPMGYDRGGYLPPGLHTVYNGTGRMETITPPGAGKVGGGACRHVVDLRLNGRQLQTILLDEKRRNGGRELGIA